MSDTAVQFCKVSKNYRLYRHPVDKVLDVLGVNRLLYWRRGYFDEFWALRDASFSVVRGERVGIIGPNGAGKSTALKLMAGMLQPHAGQVEVQGRIHALMELGTWFHPELTGWQNIRAALAYQGFTPGEISKKERQIADFAEVGEFIRQPLRTYSAGMYARLAFSAAMSAEPDILILDEILGTGDAYFSGKCVRCVREMADDRKLTLFYVSHDMPSVLSMCDRVIWIDRGRILQDGEPLDVVRGYYREMQRREHAGDESPSGSTVETGRGTLPGDPTAQGIPTRSVVTWKEPDPRIEHLRFLDDNGQEIRSLAVGHDLTVEIAYHAGKTVAAPVFALSFYLPNGTAILHANTVLGQYPIDQITGAGKLRFVFPAFNVGAGDYVVSCSIFEHLNPASNLQPRYYDQHDRSYRLSVRKDPQVAINLGVVRSPYRIEHDGAPADAGSLQETSR